MWYQVTAADLIYLHTSCERPEDSMAFTWITEEYQTILSSNYGINLCHCYILSSQTTLAQEFPNALPVLNLLICLWSICKWHGILFSRPLNWIIYCSSANVTQNKVTGKLCRSGVPQQHWHPRKLLVTPSFHPYSNYPYKVSALTYP